MGPNTVRSASPFRSPNGPWHRFLDVLIAGFALTTVAAFAAILGFIALRTAPLLYAPAVMREVSFDRLLFPQVWDGEGSRWAWQPSSSVPKYSVLPLLVGSLKITAVALLIATPISILAAIFVSQIAPRRLRMVLKPTIELLAGVPSVVLGVFALLVLATWLQRTFHFEHRLNVFLSGMALSLTIMPIVFTIAEDALSAVPRSFTDAALALGATRLHAVRHVVLPAAMPGLYAAVVLGFGRAIGETMVVLMASGNAPLLDASVGRSARTITATLAQEMAEAVAGSAHAVALFSLAGLLVLLSFVTNWVADSFARAYERRIRGQGMRRK